jgi:hypothetical protein
MTIQFDFFHNEKLGYGCGNIVLPVCRQVERHAVHTLRGLLDVFGVGRLLCLHACDSCEFGVY